MENSQIYITMENFSFEYVSFAHSLAADNYAFRLNTQSRNSGAKLSENVGILEIGFVEENPLICTGSFGEFIFEENGIFIIPPQCDFSVRTLKADQFHRHTMAEFAVTCTTKKSADFVPPEGKNLTLPLYIPPSPENSDIFKLIRSIACAKTAQISRSYFEECADFMTLIHKLLERVQQCHAGRSVASPGNRRHCIRAKAYVSENIDRRLTVGDVAKAIGVSKNYLTNVFSSTEGIPLMEYINRSKLSYMMVLIRRYDYTLAQAGKHVGFTDVNYISRIFRRYYGMTVTEYKRSLELEDTQK